MKTKKNAKIPRPEHPKPQFARESWMNLNGIWDFEIDNERSGLARGLAAPDAGLAKKILVPFCPESRHGSRSGAKRRSE